MKLKCCFYVLGWAILAALGGCVNLDPKPDLTRFYTLSPQDFAAESAELVTVEVTRLPYYAQTRRIPLRKGHYEIVFFPLDRWTGPLDRMLADRLRERFGPVARSAQRGDWRLRVEVLACEGRSEGDAVFGADYVLWCGEAIDPLAMGRFLERVPWDPKEGAGALVETLGTLVDSMADRIAAQLPSAK